ncbi:MAG: efflux RND transporter periplasmic adaptor subunit [Clostridiales bacterium]|nr:efflux RND transporter periplasmic adaptor subunit [Clostridiales bacterium]
MKYSLMKIMVYVFLIFIGVIFIAGYSSDKIQEALLPKVDTFRAYSISEVDVTVPFQGEIDVKEKERIRFYYPVNIVEWYVEEGEKIEVNQPIFRIDNLSVVTELTEEKESIEIEIENLKLQYKSLTGGSFTGKKLELLKSELIQLEDKLTVVMEINDDGLYYQDIDALKNQIENKKYDISLSLQNISDTSFEQSNESSVLQSDILKLQNKVLDLEKKYAFYEHVSSDGICYASEAGVITDLVGSGYHQIDTPIMTVNNVDMDEPFVYKASFDQAFAYLIQKNNTVLLDYDPNKPPVSAKITKVYDAVKGVSRIEAIIESDKDFKIGQVVSGRSLQEPGSKANIPRTAIISKGEIKNNTRVEFYCVLYEGGILGNSATLVKSYGSVAYVGDEYIGLSDKTLPDSFTYIVVDNPEPTLKSGDRITE